MLEAFSDRIKKGLRGWTRDMVGQGLDERVALIPRTQNEYGVDPFGFDVDYTLAAVAPLVWMYKHYFRVETHGIQNVPAGRVLLVSNHSGQLPFDGAMIGLAMLLEATPPRAVRSMVEKWVPTLPYVSTFMARVGQIVGTPENCRRLLNDDEAILVFPEGLRGIAKHFSQRYRLQQFGLGFMRLALETKTPIVPVAVVGAEEQAPVIYDAKVLGNLFGLPVLPISSTLLPIPLPVKYRIYFGEPIVPTGTADDEDAELERKVKEVSQTIQTMLNQGVRQRTSVFF